jgi:phosphoglycolate phosphatase-like HAD superfamily hydrolase
VRERAPTRTGIESMSAVPYTHPIEAVISDWCGTIEANVEQLLDGIKGACLATGLPEPSSSDLRAISGMTAKEVVEYLEPSDWPEPKRDAFRAIMQQIGKTQAHKLLINQDTLSWFKQHIRLCLFTNGSRAKVDGNLQKYQLQPFFEHIATCDDYPAKPDPAMLVAIQHKLGIPSNACLVIGDHHNDLLAANAAGMPCVIVLTGVLTREDFDSISPQPLCYCEDINAVPQIIRQIRHQIGQP